MFAMEQWSFPPRSDPAYLPDARSRYWFPVRETMPPADRERAILARLKELTRYAWGTLVSSHELALMKRLLEYPEIIEAAARELAPHMIAYYLKDLAGDLHTYYNAEKFLVDDEALKHARLALVSATRRVLANGLGLLGVQAPEKM